MSTVNIHLSYYNVTDVLEIGFNYGTDCEKLKDTKIRIDDLQNCGILEGGNIILLSMPDKNPYVLSYIVSRLSALYGSIAVYDAYIADYIIVSCKNLGYEIGQVLNLKE